MTHKNGVHWPIEDIGSACPLDAEWIRNTIQRILRLGFGPAKFHCGACCCFDLDAGIGAVGLSFSSLMSGCDF